MCVFADHQACCEAHERKNKINQSKQAWSRVNRLESSAGGEKQRMCGKWMERCKNRSWSDGSELVAAISAVRYLWLIKLHQCYYTNTHCPATVASVNTLLLLRHTSFINNWWLPGPTGSFDWHANVSTHAHTNTAPLIGQGHQVHHNKRFAQEAIWQTQTHPDIAKRSTIFQISPTSSRRKLIFFITTGVLFFSFMQLQSCNLTVIVTGYTAN